MVMLSLLVIIGSVESTIPCKATKRSSAQITPNAGINCVVDFILHLQMFLITATVFNSCFHSNYDFFFKRV